ncbi:hypothetical protein SK128_024409, partial [Halocaridina rubra]
MFQGGGNLKAGNRCKYCGRSYQPRKCPANGKTCNKCKKNNYFANVCSQINEIQSTDIPHDEIIQTLEGYECKDNAGVRAFLGKSIRLVDQIA